MLDINTKKKFTPWPQSRKSEFTSWGLAIVLFVGLFFVPENIILARNIVWVLSFGFTIFGSLISFSNLLDRRTVLMLDSVGIEFTNSLRKVVFSWEDVQRVQVIPSRWGEKVFIIGEFEKFSFLTEGQVVINDQVKGKVGFQHGRQILDTILHQTGLSSTKKHQTEKYYYYQKE